MRTRVVVATVLLVFLAGCTGGALSFEANPATIEDSALEEAGYDAEPLHDHTVTERIEAAGLETDVTITTWVSGATNPDTEASVVVISIPDADIAGQSLNPIVHGGDRALIERALEHLGGDEDDVSELEEIDSTERTILDSETEITTYETVAETDYGEVPVHIHVATVSHDGDVIVIVGTHAEMVDERDTILDLMESVEH